MFASGFFLLYDESHMLHFALVFCAGGHDINASRIDACVSEYICELGNVLLKAVEGAREQMAEIVGKYLAR